MKKLLLGALAALACAVPTGANAQASGDLVLSHYQDHAQLYPATVVSVSGTTVTLLWDDGTTSDVYRRDLRRYNWQVGTLVSCRWNVDNEYYPARITQMGDDTRTLTIRWTQDGTTARTNTGRCRSGG